MDDRPCKHLHPDARCPVCKHWDADSDTGRLLRSTVPKRQQVKTYGAPLPQKGKCAHLGFPTGREILCPSCSGTVQLKIIGCEIHGDCTVAKKIAGVACCKSCPDYQEVPDVNWSYGITTVPSRKDSTLKRTLSSLALAGFDKPRLFVDGCTTQDALHYERDFGLEVSHRSPPALRAFGNWILALWELYVRRPEADRYALFQDDVISSSNLRQYLDRCKLGNKEYWNLITYPQNQSLAKGTDGWFPSNQCGLGAQGLVFSRQGVIDLLSERWMSERPMDAHRGHRAVDGGISHSMKAKGYRELCHNPSLLRHIGDVTTIPGNGVQPLDESFRGETYDLLTLLPPGPPRPLQVALK